PRTPWRRKENEMQRVMGTKESYRLTLVGVLVALLGLLAPAWPAAAATYSFNLLGSNTAEFPLTGDHIRVTGAGSFDTVAETVEGSGSFAHFAPDGTLVFKGTWEATGFTSFDSFGGPSPGQQGGVLSITVTAFPSGGGSF